MFPPKSFIVSGLMFRSLIHFEFNFVHAVRVCSDFILLHVAVWFFQDHLLFFSPQQIKMAVFSIVYSCLLCQRLIDLIGVCVSFLALYAVPLIYMYVLVPVYHTFLMTVALQQSKVREPDSSRSILFFPSGLLLLSVYFVVFLQIYKFFCSSSMENAIGSLTGIMLNLQIALSSSVILAMLSLPIQEHNISFHLFVSSQISFISVVQFSEYRSFASLGSFFFSPLRYVILFNVMVNENTSLISLSDL